MAAVLPSFNGTQSSLGTDGWHRQRMRRTLARRHTRKHVACMRPAYAHMNCMKQQKEHISITGGCYLDGHLIIEITCLSPNKVWQFKIPHSPPFSTYLPAPSARHLGGPLYQFKTIGMWISAYGISTCVLQCVPASPGTSFFLSLFENRSQMQKSWISNYFQP